MTVGFVFPGQGSQALGMLSELANTEPVVRETFAEASAVLGYDLWQLCQEGPQEALDSTERTQPALLTASVATWRVWRQHGGALPQSVAGHSLGEYSALVCAEALDFRAAVDLVRFRGQQMQAAVPPGQGAMAALLGLEDADVEAACREATSETEIVQAANFNSPGQIVIAGHAAAVTRALEIAKTKGAKRAIPLPVSVPSHSPLMRPAADRLAARLREVTFRAGNIPSIYTGGAPTHGDPETMRAALVEQLVSPVRWTETVRSMLEGGVNLLIECGPGRVLTGLNRRIERDKRIGMLAIEDAASLQVALDTAAALASTAA